MYLKDQEIYFGFRNLFISQSDQRNISVSHVSIFSVVITNINQNTIMRRITTFQSKTDRIYDGGPIILQYNIILLTIVLQLPTVFSTVTCCTGL